MNPFKFGTVVDEPFFINRKEELAEIDNLINSENHLTIISPRRYGKTSLLRKALVGLEKHSIYLDLQLIVTPMDFASQLLKRIYRIFPFNRLKSQLKSFRVIPALTVNPVTGEVDVSFRPDNDTVVPLEDVLNLIDKLGSEKRRIVVVLDEFQEIFRIDKGLDRILRSIMQNHKNVNYIFSGSSESMMREIFENKKSPFYHFAYIMPLRLIPREEFTDYLVANFSRVTEYEKAISSDILEETGSHPYYTQQLAFVVWNILNSSGYNKEITRIAVDEILQNQDNNYERLWYGLNRTDMKVLIGMSASDIEPLSNKFAIRFNAGSDSTVYSSLQRLMYKGILIKEGRSYFIDDPFFKRWIVMRRER